ncbi:PaaX family transcriptional regulator C-terminal domain-containing protein [Cochlodiniinecator piscidefendens]|uniref:PaaX family transcriptional regulator C-terminal domain-containing protein n=1 Tax=Cochlodiniinecator piscidefendens TaxID=2715756 RepID=UPI00140AB465|nr:PaaX family transcriptional regulator C-terminal domain-containing protein [Cochlodiniinecator piscidefendens]
MAEKNMLAYTVGMITFSQFDKAANILTEDADIRAWSIIVTLFGDLAQDKGDWVSVAALTALCEKISIKPEALRVALHRLRKDGWLESEKKGRTSWYTLTDWGRAQSIEVSPRIYSDAITFPPEYHLLISEPMAQSKRAECDQLRRSEGYLIVAPGSYLKLGRYDQADGNALVVEGAVSFVPEWLKMSVFSDALCDSYKMLEQRLQQLSIAPSRYSPAEVAMLRVLIVHNWRRVLLRHIELPAEFHPNGWRGVACRSEVVHLLAQLEKPKLSQLHEGIS